MNAWAFIAPPNHHPNLCALTPVMYMALMKKLAAPLPLFTAIFLAGCAAHTNVRGAPAFEAFLARADKAQLEFQQGNPGPYKSLWSHRPDVTLAGGFGGAFERGWDRVSRRLDWASSQFRDGRNRIRRLASGSSGDIGYLVQTEELAFTNAGKGKAVERKYRVTMLFRREQGEWRIIHRHADSQNEKVAPK